QSKHEHSYLRTIRERQDGRFYSASKRQTCDCSSFVSRFVTVMLRKGAHTYTHHSLLLDVDRSQWSAVNHSRACDLNSPEHHENQETTKGTKAHEGNLKTGFSVVNLRALSS